MSTSKFISPLYDTTIKRLFKSEVGKAWLTKLIFQLTGINLDEYTPYDQEYTTGNAYRDYRMDTIFVKDNRNYTVNIEMYKDYNEEDTFKSRAYVVRILDFAYSQDKKYNKKYCYQINFNDGYFKYNKEVDILRCQIRDKDNKYDFDDLLIYDVFLSNFKYLCYNESEELEAMLSLLRCSTYEEMLKIANGNKEAVQVIDELRSFADEEDFSLAYESEKEARKREQGKYDLGREEGIEIGRQEGIQEGRNEANLETAKKMFHDNLSLDKISQYTGLSIEEINKLNN